MSTQPTTRAQMRNRHRARRSRHRGRTLSLLSALAAVAIATSGLAIWGYNARGAVSCGDSPVNLRVVTSTSLVAAVKKEAAAYERTVPQVGGACVSVDVKALDVPDVNDALVEASQEKRDPGFDVWIPESSTWAKVLSRRPEIDRLLPDVFSVLASSPVVAAMPEPMATAIGWPNRVVELQQMVALAQQPQGWAKFGHPEWGRVRVGWQSPQASTAGLDSLMTLFASLPSDPAQLRGGMLQVQNALSTLNVDPAVTSAALTDPSLTPEQAMRKSMITPSTEWVVRAFNKTGPRIRLAAVPVGVSGAATRIGYLPVFGTSLDRARAMTASDGFRDFLGTAKGNAAFAEAGWRVPTGASGTDSGPAVVGAGASAHEITPARLELSVPTLQSITRALQSWSALERRGSVLLAVDVSGSMKQQIPRLGLSRLELAQKALASSVTSFSDRSSIGLWEFSRRLNGKQDYRSVVPLGLSADAVGGGTRRQAVLAGIKNLQARGDTGLYDTTLAAVREVQGKWTPDTDVVVILSDGKNDDPGSISLQQLTSTLSKERSADKPVRVFTIGYGGDADTAALRAIAKATGGTAFAAQSAADLEQVLLAALTN